MIFPVGPTQSPAWFTFSSEASKALRPISELLFAQLLAYGQLSLNQHNQPEAQIMSQLEQRIAPIRLIFEALESEGGLRFGDRSVPYLYNRIRWPNLAPLAGYTGSTDLPRPSDVLVSLGDSWALQAHLRHWTSPLLRQAALWRCGEDGLANTIEWLFDLMQHGFLLNSEAIASLASRLLLGRSQVGSDQELVERCFPGGKPQDGTTWREAFGTFTWVTSDGLCETSVAIVSSLVERCLATIDQVWQATNLDEWIQGQCVVYGTVWATQSVVAKTMRDVPLGLQSVLSQLEEIRADSGALYGEWTTEPSYEHDLSYAKQLAAQFDRLGIEGEERFHSERLLVPVRLRPFFPGRDGDPMPSEWNRLTWKLAVPWTAVSGRRRYAACLRAIPFSVSELLQVSELRDFLHTHGVVDPKQQELAVHNEYLMPFMFRFPPEGASFTDDEIREAVIDAHSALYMQQMTERIEEARALIDRGEAEQAISNLRSFLDLYYAADPVLEMLGIAYSKIGDQEAALQQMIPAIVLKPGNRERWVLLSQVLRSLGHNGEASLTQAVSERLAV